MKTLAQILFLCLLIQNVSAARPDTLNRQPDTGKVSLPEEINAEKNQITEDYPSVAAGFVSLTDSITSFILHQQPAGEKRDLYLSRLLSYLSDINQYYSESFFKSGAYSSTLGYYPMLIQWDQKGELEANLKKYPSFFVKAARLIPSDTLAEAYLSNYMLEHPDDIFRYAGEFEDRSFALRLLERAVKLAPESAKRYLATENPVSTILAESNDLYAKKAREIYTHFGMKSHAFILLDAVVKDNMPLGVADSISSNPAAFFTYLVNLSSRKDATVTYSMYRYLSENSAQTMHDIAQEAVANPEYNFDDLNRLSANEIFVLLGYGFREITLHSFGAICDMMIRKAGSKPISSVLIASMDKYKLRDFVIYCNKSQQIDNILNLVEDEKKVYLIGLPGLKEKEDLAQPGISPDGSRDISANGSSAKPANPGVVPVANMGSVDIHSSGENRNTASTGGIKKVTTNAGLKAHDKAPAPLKAERNAVKEPEPYVEPVKITLDERSKVILSLKKNIFQTIQNIPSFVNSDYAEEVLTYAAQKEPDELFKKINAFKGKFFCKRILETCAIYAPVSASRYLYNPQQPVNYILQYSKDSTVKRILEYSQRLGYSGKPLLLLDDLYNNRITLQDASATCSDPDALFRAMVKIISRGQYLGRYSIDREMRDYSLRFIRELNNQIASGAPQPFTVVEGFSPAELYFLMLYGRDEVFSSTFNGLFNRFLQKIPATGGEAFISSVNYCQFRDFLSLCANYRNLEQFLSRFDPGAKNKLLLSYISKLESEQDQLSTIVLIAEGISNTRDNELLSFLQTNIKKEYERVKAANNQVGISIYGVLSSIISGNAKVDASWYRTIARQFQISPATSLPSSVFFDSASVCTEQMYFYDDDDGQSSFENFMNSYRHQAAWGVEDMNDFVRVYSKSGKKVEILANKPSTQENGLHAIAAYLLAKGLTPTVIVHRGHSFHTEATLEKVPRSAKLIFVGSCGGFYKIPIALENAPDAHIISTKQVGTKIINDPMLFALNEDIRNGNNIDWIEFWDKMRSKLGNNLYFGDYVPPHKNLEAIFIRAYYKVLGV